MTKQMKLLTTFAICSLIGGVAGAAPSVRALGTNNSYVGTANAVSAKSGSVGGVSNKTPSALSQARVSTVRLTPKTASTNKSTSGFVATKTSTDSASASVPGASARLSIGKYLNGKKTSGGGTSSGTGTGGGATSVDLTAINNQLDSLSAALESLRTQISSLTDKEQQMIGNSSYITIDTENETIDIDVDELKKEISTTLGDCQVELGLADGLVQWKYKNPSSYNATAACRTAYNTNQTWNNFVDLETYLSGDDIQNAINEALNGLTPPENAGQYFYKVDAAGAGEWVNVIFVDADGNNVYEINDD